MTFRIHIDRELGQPVGLGIDMLDEVSLVIDSMNEGVVKSWNDKHPDSSIGCYDRIIELNCISGNSSKMLATLKNDVAWDLTLQRPVETQVRVNTVSEQSKSLGLTLTHSLNGTSLVIMSMEEGQMCKWNEQNTNSMVRKNDRIIEVNGVRGSALKLIQEGITARIDKAPIVNMVVCRYLQATIVNIDKATIIKL